MPVNTKIKKEVTFLRALFPILSLIAIIIYGLVLRPIAFNQPQIPLEVIFISAAVVTVCELFYLGYDWEEIQDSILKKLMQALPAFYILFAIGIIIGSWMVSGTIPMLVYYGIKMINPTYIYLVAFVVPIVFSSLTGTSWGSVGTIGVVIIGIATTIDAHLGIVAGAVIGGAYFGDKMSPLSDTTNLAALGAGVDLYEHIRSMLYTTGPSALIASVLYFILGFIYPVSTSVANNEVVSETLAALEAGFNFNILLLLPAAIVLYGSITKKPTLPVLMSSSIISCLLAFVFQGFTSTEIIQTFYKGFNVEMITWVSEFPDGVITILNRGGLYNLSEAAIISFMVFTYIGAIDLINAMPIVVDKVFGYAKTRRSTILSTLIATAVTNSMTSNQYATSFIIGDAFKSKYDRLGISRKVLSRSLEDTGTMIEPMVPWTTTAIFMVATLGVPYSEYVGWQFLSIINFIVAPTLAITGIGCFYKEESNKKQEAAKA